MEFKTLLNLSIFGSIDLETQLKATSRAGFKVVGLRMNVIQDYLSQGNSLDKVKQKLEQLGLDPLEMNFFANWIFSVKSNRQEILTKFKDFVSVAKNLGSKILVLPTLYENLTTHMDMGLAVENYQALCDMAAEYDMVAGFEFVPCSEINTVKKAWEVVGKANRPNAGIVLDTIHFFEGNSSLRDLETIPVDKIVMFHINDLERVVETDYLTLTRNYRVLPGDGIYHFEGLLKYFFDHQYQGYYNLEIFNPKFVKENPLTVAINAKKSLDTLLQNFRRS